MHSTLFRAFAIVASLAGSSASANAAMVISSAPTSNVTCAKATCTATAANAVLNVGRLQRMLATENPKIVSGSAANDIVISAALTWVSSHTLTLDAYHSVVVNNPVTITGTGGLTLLTNNGGTGGMFSFGTGGNVSFWDLSSKLTINGNAYTLVNNIAMLSSDIIANAAGHYALAENYDASADGIYSSAPMYTITGTLEGLGNTIANLTITETYKGQYVGLFRAIDSSGMVENLTLANAQITSGVNADVGALVGRSYGLLSGISVNGSIVSGNASSAGALAGESDGNIFNSHATATVHGCCRPGGLAGVNGGEIRDSYATGAVTDAGAGGLVSINDGIIAASYATGSVKGKASGGLVGVNFHTITNSYAKGKVSGGDNAILGGLIGINEGSPNGTIIDSYSTGKIVGGSGSTIGGFIGEDDSASGSIANSYWDTTTSGISDPSKGAGNVGSDSGTASLTTVQLRAGLPTGFDPSIWVESSTINGGLPYLLDNPPP